VALEEAQRLLDAGRPFHAHEILEGTWKAAPEPERDLWQGLAQLAVGLTHLLRGNQAGATTLLQRARRRLAGYADDPPYGVDVDGLTGWADAVLAELARGVTPRPGTPQLRQSVS
jgi:predicted metal-dependent hydrolase